MHSLKPWLNTFFLFGLLILTSCGQSGGNAPDLSGGSSSCGRALSASWTPSYASIQFYLGANGTIGDSIVTTQTITADIGTNLQMNDGGDGSVMTYVDGVVGQAISSASADFNDDKLQQTSNDSNVDQTGDFTISLWIYNNLLAADSIFAKGLNGANEWNLWVDVDGTLVFDRNSERETSTDTITNGAWYHLAVVVDSTAKTVTFYINGTADSGGALSYTADGSGAASSLAIFNNSTDFGGPNAIMDEIAIWNVALSAADINTIYSDASSCI